MVLRDVHDVECCRTVVHRSEAKKKAREPSGLRQHVRSGMVREFLFGPGRGSALVRVRYAYQESAPIIEHVVNDADGLSRYRIQGCGRW